MISRRLGTSDVSISPIVLGTSQFSGMKWGDYTDNLAVRVTHAAIDAGVTTIDTAPAYGVGRAETLVGNAIADRREKVVIATKCGLHWHSDTGRFQFERGGCRVYQSLRPDSIARECELSLRRLRTDYIDLYQCHQVDPTVPVEDTIAGMMRLREEGKILAFGVSNHPVDLIERCVTAGPIASNQPQYSLLERGIEVDVLPFCRDHGVGLLVYSPLAKGLLTGAVATDRVIPEDDHRHDHPWFSREFRERVQAALEPVRPIADRHGATLGQVALNWTVGRPGITAAIVGARSPEQVAENADSPDFTLDATEIDTISSSFEALPKVA